MERGIGEESGNTEVLLDFIIFSALTLHIATHDQHVIINQRHPSGRTYEVPNLFVYQIFPPGRTGDGDSPTNNKN